MHRYIWSDRQPKQFKNIDCCEQLREKLSGMLHTKSLVLRCGSLDKIIFADIDLECQRCFWRMKVFGSLNRETGEILIAPAWSGYCPRIS